MAELPELIRQYSEVLDEEGRLAERKERLRRQILAEMERLNVTEARYSSGRAQRSPWFKLVPRRDAVLRLLASEDLFPFAHFTAAKVKEILVPKYGRESLLPLFDVQRSERLVIKRPQGDPGPPPET